jgi:hypothetical protein
MAQEATLSPIVAQVSIPLTEAYQRTLSDFDEQMITDLDDAFFPTQDFFCEQITIEHAAPYSDSETYSGYFEDPTRDVSPNSSIRVTALHPMIELSVPHLAQYPTMEDVIVIRGIRYTIDFIDDEGTGVIRIYLLREGKQV